MAPRFRFDHPLQDGRSSGSTVRSDRRLAVSAIAEQHRDLVIEPPNLDIARLREQAKVNGDAAKALTEQLTHVLDAKDRKRLEFRRTLANDRGEAAGAMADALERYRHVMTRGYEALLLVRQS